MKNKYLKKELKRIHNTLLMCSNIYANYSVITKGCALDNLINDRSSLIRKAVATQGYGLEILISDKEWPVRLEVARQGYGLDRLINDEDYRVREIAQLYHYK